jgi:glucokinase
MSYDADQRIVMTLDAGGTNFVFTAIQAQKQVVKEITIPSNADNLQTCLAGIVDGFRAVQEKLRQTPAAISFAFPGPADYPSGIIGDLGNLPAFRGGIALGPMLKETFGLPVFINNDGDLYAYGEAIAGYLPRVNSLLAKAGSTKRYKNLLGLTLGTGFGGGIVHDGNLLLGDNSIAGEVWLLRNKLRPEMNIEEHASIRGIRRIYAREAGIKFDDAPEPKDLFEIVKGRKDGNRQAALAAFQEMGEAVGDAISNAITLIDGIVVIGGGLSGAAEVFLPSIVKEMNNTYTKPDGTKFRRLAANVYNLEDEAALKQFVKGSTKEVTVPGTNRTVKYDPEMRIGVGVTKIGTSNAISVGAYAYALYMLDHSA